MDNKADTQRSGGSSFFYNKKSLSIEKNFAGRIVAFAALVIIVGVPDRRICIQRYMRSIRKRDILYLPVTRGLNKILLLEEQLEYKSCYNKH